MAKKYVLIIFILFLSTKCFAIETPFNVRGIYVSGWSAATPSSMKYLKSLINDTEINTIVLDIKDEYGVINFRADTQNTDILKASQNRIKNIEPFIDDLHEDNIYVVGRIATFQDSIYAKNHPQSAIKGVDGKIWQDKKGLLWVNPQSQDFINYLIDLAKLSSKAGFDEIQFDYIRFPSDGILQNAELPSSSQKDEIISNIIQKLNDELNNQNIKTSFDIFGQTINTGDGMGIGQNFDRLIDIAQTLSPMIYPSHYVLGFKNIPNPNQEPSKTINKSIADGVKKIENKDKTLNILRPWIQDFSINGVFYTAGMVREQIQALYDNGIFSWILWSPRNIYSKDALLPSNYLLQKK